MQKNDHDALLKAFGASLGLDLTFDENRVCELYFDNRLDIFIRAEDDDGILILSTVLAERLPEDIPYSLILDMLDSAGMAYDTGGNVPLVGRDEDSGFLILYEVCTASYLARTPLSDIFTSFLQAHQDLCEEVRA